MATAMITPVTLGDRSAETSDVDSPASPSPASPSRTGKRKRTIEHPGSPTPGTPTPKSPTPVETCNGGDSAEAGHKLKRTRSTLVCQEPTKSSNVEDSGSVTPSQEAEATKAKESSDVVETAASTSETPAEQDPPTAPITLSEEKVAATAEATTAVIVPSSPPRECIPAEAVGTVVVPSSQPEMDSTSISTPAIEA